MRAGEGRRQIADRDRVPSVSSIQRWQASKRPGPAAVKLSTASAPASAKRSAGRST